MLRSATTTPHSWTKVRALALALALAAALAATLAAGVADADPTAFTVTTTENAGDGSLRQAITDANTNPASVDTIDFDIPAAADSGCDTTTGVCTISPTSALPEITQAVEVDGYSQPGASPNTLSTGSDADLKIVLSGENAGSGTVGIKITGSDSVIKGLVINRWQRHGVELKGPGATGNKIEGNFVGTDASGIGDLGNSSIGVLIDQAPDNVVGGTSAAARNVISGNRFGAFVSSASGNRFEGNFIGTDKNGTADLGNSTLGVQINNAPDNVVGGTEDGAGNLISGNNQGIFVNGPDASGNAIEGNLIGTDASGARDLGNSQGGVLIQDGPDNVVGGNSAAAGNTISENGENGIAVSGDTATGNGILRNSVSGNGELGIALSGGTDNASGVTENDSQDPDTGPDNLQNYPTIASAVNASGKTTLKGTLNSTPESTFLIQFFSGPNADTSGHGEGETYVGQTSVTTDAGGEANFEYTPDTLIEVGQVVAATATNSATGDTSEFSTAVEVGDFTVTNTDDSGAGSLRQAMTNANNSTGADAIDFAIPATGDSGCDATSGVCTISPASALPEVTEAVSIDGYTQDGASENTLATGNDAELKIELSGSVAGATSGGDGIKITGSNSVVKGLIINRWQGDGVEVNGSGATGNKIEGNFIGTDATGTADLGDNSSIGVHIVAAPDNTVGGTSAAARNTISGNGLGILIFRSGATGNKIEGNYVGTDKNGTADLGNSFVGMQITDAPNNTVGGTATGAGNLISGNDEGLYVQGSSATNNKIEGNYVGTDASGTADLGNYSRGVQIVDAPNNSVGGTSAAARNIISGNGDGLVVASTGATGNKIEGNYIGTDKNGTTDLGNTGDGVHIADAPDNSVGGASAAARNIISANGGDGVEFNGSGASGNTIKGNHVGTDASGAADLGNTGDGVRIVDTPNNVVGGTASGAGNVISGNGGDGVEFNGSGATGNKIEGNYIGTDKNGTTDLGNTGDGVHIADAPDNSVGGTSTAARNIISANDDGVLVDGSEASGNHVEGNYIGTDASGTGDLGNSLRGVWINDAPGNTVGGTTSAASNTIFNNDHHGVVVSGDSATGNALPRNSLHENGGLGIELAGGSEDASGVTENDPQDADAGANRVQNYPVITAATAFGEQTTLQVALHSTPNDAFIVQFFKGPSTDPSGHGEGKTYIGQETVTVNASGNATFDFTPNAPIGEGQVVAATATNAVTRDTSEFSRTAEVEDNAAPDTTIDSGPTGTVASASASFGFSSTEPGSTFECSLDGAAFSSCQSPKTYPGLTNGPHTLSVRATDQAGNTDQTPAQRSFTVDTLAPTVTSVTPPAAKTLVSRTTNVTATFSEAMRGASLRATGTFTLIPPPGATGAARPPVAATVGYDVASKKLTLNPTNSLARNTTYTAKITTAAKDSAGNRLAADKVWRFTTAP